MKDAHWVYVVCGFLAIVMIAGGSSLPGSNTSLVFSVLSIAVLIFGLWRLHFVDVSNASKFALILLAAGLGLMFLQLLPLPQVVWMAMGGREFVAESFQALQLSSVWQPLSLSPDMTRQDILAVLPAVAMFVAMLSVPVQQHKILAASVIGLAGLGLVFSLLKYGSSAVSGGFSNPNFFAAQIYMSLPFVITGVVQKFYTVKWPLFGAAVFCGIVAIGQTGSRFALILAAMVVLLSVLSQQNMQRKTASIGLISLAVLTVAVLLFGGTGLERIGGLQSALATRGEMFATSVSALFSFLPAGSGFGSFVPIYQLFEHPQSITETYVNHAHNDWVELVVEGGLAMAVLIVLFLSWMTKAVQAAWVSSSAFGKPAAISAVAVLVHSLADYPLRTPALMVLFALCCGVMARVSVRQRANETDWVAREHGMLPA